MSNQLLTRETRPVIFWLGQVAGNADRTPYVYGLKTDKEGRTEVSATDGYMLVRCLLPAGNEQLANMAWDSRPVKKTAGEPVAIAGIKPPDFDACYPETQLDAEVAFEVVVNPHYLKLILEGLSGQPPCVRLRFWGHGQPITIQGETKAGYPVHAMLMPMQRDDGKGETWWVPKLKKWRPLTFTLTTAELRTLYAALVRHYFTRPDQPFPAVIELGDAADTVRQALAETITAVEDELFDKRLRPTERDGRLALERIELLQTLVREMNDSGPSVRVNAWVRLHEVVAATRNLDDGMAVKLLYHSSSAWGMERSVRWSLQEPGELAADEVERLKVLYAMFTGAPWGESNDGSL